MSEIAQNIISLKKQIPSSVRLVAVSKTKSAAEILEAYDTGHRIFGENRVQEIISKKELLPHDIEWHYIGHLQSNKIRFIAPFISTIQSVDTYRLLKIINNEALKINRVIDCLLQFHIAREETKFGFSMEEVNEMLGSEDFYQLKQVRICGVMGMATLTDDTHQVRNEFKMLYDHFTKLKTGFFPDQSSFKEISMGMSGDFRIAIEEGSTIIRIGSIIFAK
jgi:pyridoxal phosphate enzyme (YggS family)